MSELEPIRVLCVFSTLDRGGAESMCMNLYRYIDRSKVQFDFVKHTYNRGAFENEIESLGGRIYEAPRYKIYNQIPYMNWWENHLVNHPEHQVVHGHFFGISSVYFSICKKMGRKTIAHSHCTRTPASLHEERVLKHVAKRILISNISRYADVRLACSKQAGHDVFGDAEFTVLNNAIATDRFRWNPDTSEEVRRELGLGDALVLGNVSRFNLQKNPHGMLDIFQAVHDRRPNSKLLWVGDGSMRQEVQERAVELGLVDDIVFTGVRADVNRMLQAMDVFVLPSFYEGLPVVAIEAQAAGLRCLIGDGVTREADVTGLCEFLPLRRGDKWVAAILADTGERVDTSELIVSAGYDVSSTAAKIQNTYLSLSRTAL